MDVDGRDARSVANEAARRLFGDREVVRESAVLFCIVTSSSMTKDEACSDALAVEPICVDVETSMAPSSISADFPGLP